MEKKNTGLIVTIILLIVIVLGLGGYIVYDKFLKDTEDNKETTEVKEEILALDSEEVKGLTDVTKFSYFDFDINNNESLLKVAAYSVDEEEYLSYENDSESKYFTTEILKKHFDQLFGSDRALILSDISFKSTCGYDNIEFVYEKDSSIFKIENYSMFELENNYCELSNGAFKINYSEIYKAIKKDDTIEVYAYLAKIRDLRSTFNGTAPYCYIYSNEDIIFSSESSSCKADVMMNLKNENKIETYKVTYQKQSDGKYYPIKGEWQ